MIIIVYVKIMVIINKTPYLTQGEVENLFILICMHFQLW